MESRDSVQMFLNGLTPADSFAVLAKTKAGEQRVFVGKLMPSANRQDNVPIETEKGIKSFNVNRVLWIGYPDQCQSLIETIANKESNQ